MMHEARSHRWSRSPVAKALIEREVVDEIRARANLLGTYLGSNDAIVEAVQRFVPVASEQDVLNALRRLLRRQVIVATYGHHHEARSQRFLWVATAARCQA
jgi:hypothetical protein